MVGSTPPESYLLRMSPERSYGSYELNFIHGLQSLDHHTCHNLDLLSATQLFERQIDISQCFHTSSYQNVPIPSKNLGLADDDVDQRLQFVTGLYYVIKSWKGDKPAMLANNLSDLSPKATIELEKVVAKYYCQQFFNYFRHAAQVPYCLFSM